MVFSLCDVGPAGRMHPGDGAGPAFSTSSSGIRHESSEDEPARATNGGSFSNALTVPADRESLATVRDMRRRLAAGGPEYIRTGGDFERVSLPNDDCDALRDVLLAQQALVVIEIGLAYGSSALAIGEALLSQGRHGAKHVIIDAYQHLFQNAGWDAIATAGLSGLCTLLVERSQL